MALVLALVAVAVALPMAEPVMCSGWRRAHRRTRHPADKVHRHGARGRVSTHAGSRV